ncbi:MAG: acyltransferase [Caulobacterales bacterium]|nr:acyltransferase [Caulobacterales bacterium]MCA0372887.1 acyltransferase [Pseudomonadota bacterium]
MLKNKTNTDVRVEELESIRAIAALFIVLLHFPKFNPIVDGVFINNSGYMVELFFVLSGFVIYKAYNDRIKNINDVARFQFLRLGRIYPVHFLFLIVFLSFEIIKYIAYHKYNISSGNSLPFRENNWSVFFKNLFLIQGIGSKNTLLTFNYVSWSISVEFIAYFVFALLILLIPKHKIFSFIIIAFLSILANISGNDSDFKQLLDCFGGFFIGCIIAFVCEKYEFKFPRYSSLIIFSSLAIYLTFNHTLFTSFIVYCFSAALIIAISKSSDDGFKAILRTPVLIYLGQISYSIYMAHPAVEWVINQIVRKLFHPIEHIDPNNGFLVPSLGVFETLSLVFVAYAVTIILAGLVYHYIEQPLRLKSRILADKLFNKKNNVLLENV